jgi:hypothetical protein
MGAATLYVIVTMSDGSQTTSAQGMPSLHACTAVVELLKEVARADRTATLPGTGASSANRSLNCKSASPGAAGVATATRHRRAVAARRCGGSPTCATAACTVGAIRTLPILPRKNRRQGVWAALHPRRLRRIALHARRQRRRLYAHSG